MLAVKLEIGNVLSRITGLDQYLSHWLDSVTKFPTQMAMAQGDGWRPPEDAVKEVWDGYQRLTKFYPGGVAVLPTGLVSGIVQSLQGYVQWHVEDNRVRPDPGVPDRGAIALRAYQEACAEAAIRVGYGVIDAPPRSGKTRILLEIQRRISLPTLWIAPTTNIVEQTVRAAEEFYGPNYMVQVKGTQQAMAVAMSGAPIIICTAATAAVLPTQFFLRLRVLIVDEGHHAAAASYRAMFEKTHHIFHRFLATGTYLRSGDDEMALHSVLSNTIWKITTTELVALGYLVPATVVFVPINAPRIPSYANKTFNAGRGKFGIHEHGYRNSLAVWAAATLWSRQYQSVTLVGTKVQGDAIVEGLRNWVPRGNGPWAGAEFVSTNRPPKICREVIDAFVERRIPALIGTSMIGEGTDLPTADSMVFAPGGQAEVSQTQANFRVCTAVPGKRRAVIVDFVDRHHDRLMEHSEERLKTYFGQPTFHTLVMEDVSQFAGFLDQQTHA